MLLKSGLFFTFCLFTLQASQIKDLHDHGFPGLRDVKYRHFLEASRPIKHATNVGAESDGHRTKRSALYSTGVKVCPQETIKAVIGSHRAYYKLRVCQEAIWEAFRIFFDRVPNSEEYGAWVYTCQHENLCMDQLAQNFSSSQEHLDMVARRVAEHAELLEGMEVGTPEPEPGIDCIWTPSVIVLPTEANETKKDPNMIKENYEEYIVEFSITIVDPSFSKLLSGPETPQYEDVTRELTEKMLHIFRKVPGFKEIRVLGFRSEDVSVRYAVVFNGETELNDDPEGLEEPGSETDEDVNAPKLKHIIVTALKQEPSLPLDIQTLSFETVTTVYPVAAHGINTVTPLGMEDYITKAITEYSISTLTFFPTVAVVENSLEAASVKPETNTFVPLTPNMLPKSPVEIPSMGATEMESTVPALEGTGHNVTPDSILEVMTEQEEEAEPEVAEIPPMEHNTGSASGEHVTDEPGLADENIEDHRLLQSEDSSVQTTELEPEEVLNASPIDLNSDLQQITDPAVSDVFLTEVAAATIPSSLEETDKGREPNQEVESLPMPVENTLEGIDDSNRGYSGVTSVMELPAQNSSIDEGTGPSGNGMDVEMSNSLEEENGSGFASESDERPYESTAAPAMRQASTPLMTTVDRSREMVVFFSLRVTNMMFSDDLFNKSSPEYKSLENTFLELLLPYLESNLTGFKQLEILNFRNGSVVVNSKMKLDKPVPYNVTEAVHCVLEDFCNAASKRLDIEIDSRSLEVEPADQGDPCKFLACNEFSRCVVNSWTREPECLCDPGYSAANGLPCQSTCTLQPDYCLNGGQCEIIPGHGTTCRCPVGKYWHYHGERCNELVSLPVDPPLIITCLVGSLCLVCAVLGILIFINKKCIQTKKAVTLVHTLAPYAFENTLRVNPVFENDDGVLTQVSTLQCPSSSASSQSQQSEQEHFASIENIHLSIEIPRHLYTTRSEKLVSDITDFHHCIPQNETWQLPNEYRTRCLLRASDNECFEVTVL